MKNNSDQIITITEDVVVSKIYYVRGMKVMLDEDLARFYNIETRVLNQAVSRNISRFPADFMFTLTEEEYSNLKSQNVISKWGGRRNLPRVFTEHGVLMLSSILNSPQAIQVNIQIMRVYIKLREMLLMHKEISILVEQVEKKLIKQDEKIELLFTYLNRFIEKEDSPRQKIGYKP